MAELPRTAHRHRERARATWDASVGPRLRRAAEPETPLAVAVLELIRAAGSIRALGARGPDDVDRVVDLIAPATMFRREARLALIADDLRQRLGRFPSWAELIEAERESAGRSAG